MKRFAIVLLALLAPAAFADHHLNGTWKLDVALADAQGGTATFELMEEEGGVLTGTYSGAAGSAPVTGTVNGADVEFSFDSSAVGKVTYQGTFADGKLSGTCDYGMAGKGTFSGSKE
jgi:polyisoprenoid-binding protein YceI